MSDVAGETREVVALCRVKDGTSPEAQAAGYPLTRLPGERFQMTVDRIPDAVARGIVFDPTNGELDWWTAPRRILADEPALDAKPLALEPTAGALRILQGTGYDPGQAAYRFHSALNECTKHASAFVRWGSSNPYTQLRQYDGEEHQALVNRLVYEADVVHCHMNYLLLGGSVEAPVTVQHRGLVVRHYHGSRSDGTSNVEPTFDRVMNAVTVGARLQLLAEGEGMQWLPIAVPVGRYRELKRAVWKPAHEFRVAHSPTKRRIKGSDAFESAIATLQGRGLAIRAVLIEDMLMKDALVLKARCDAVFDSFWLGLQGSGLEGAAMGLPVVAGDPKAADLYREHVGYVPYTYANTEAELVSVLERLVVDHEWRRAEADRVSRYTVEVHDYPAVARRYEDILATALGRDDIRTTTAALAVNGPVNEPKARKRKKAAA
jgi:hypothetical protein